MSAQSEVVDLVTPMPSRMNSAIQSSNNAGGTGTGNNNVFERTCDFNQQGDSVAAAVRVMGESLTKLKLLGVDVDGMCNKVMQSTNNSANNASGEKELRGTAHLQRQVQQCDEGLARLGTMLKQRADLEGKSLDVLHIAHGFQKAAVDAEEMMERLDSEVRRFRETLTAQLTEGFSVFNKARTEVNDALYNSREHLALEGERVVKQLQNSCGTMEIKLKRIIEDKQKTLAEIEEKVVHMESFDPHFDKIEAQKKDAIQEGAFVRDQIRHLRQVLVAADSMQIPGPSDIVDSRNRTWEDVEVVQAEADAITLFCVDVEAKLNANIEDIDVPMTNVPEVMLNTRQHGRDKKRKRSVRVREDAEMMEESDYEEEESDHDGETARPIEWIGNACKYWWKNYMKPKDVNDAETSTQYSQFSRQQSQATSVGAGEMSQANSPQQLNSGVTSARTSGAVTFATELDSQPSSPQLSGVDVLPPKATRKEDITVATQGAPIPPPTNLGKTIAEAASNAGPHQPQQPQQRMSLLDIQRQEARKLRQSAAAGGGAKTSFFSDPNASFTSLIPNGDNAASSHRSTGAGRLSVEIPSNRQTVDSGNANGGGGGFGYLSRGRDTAAERRSSGFVTAARAAEANEAVIDVDGEDDVADGTDGQQEHLQPMGRGASGNPFLLSAQKGNPFAHH